MRRYYLSRVCKVPTLYFKEGPLSQIILEHCQVLQKPFAPTPWAFNGHAQTLLSGERGASELLEFHLKRLSLAFLLNAPNGEHGSSTFPIA